MIWIECRGTYFRKLDREWLDSLGDGNLVELTAGRLRAEGRIDHRLGRNSPEGCLFSKGDRGWAMAIRDS
jgi:hypothetical protein